MVIKLYRAWRKGKQDTVGGDIDVVPYEGIRRGEVRPKIHGQRDFGGRLRRSLTISEMVGPFEEVLGFDRFPTATIGRSLHTHIYSSDDKVSRVHARFESNSEGISITDLNSSNGTYVNGENIGQVPSPLYDHDRIQIGDTIFEVRY
ncbi:FHA domain-containing protein [archaeon]|jgi:hypothetical protein|nr:FHA domain-containing protein [archaeon]MBT4397103.1 FHA domain-containing protein [archaeon]MBT4441170.1 FHA domain-containing protein [archaeon]